MSPFVLSFIAYTAAIIVIGLLAGRRAGRSDEEYFLAGRGLGPWVSALSASASSESGWVTLGLVGWAFSSGASAFWIIPGVLFGYLFNWLVLAGRLRTQSETLGALTVPDYLALRFGERGLPLVRLLAVVVVLVGMWFYVAAQFAVAGEAFASAFPSLDGFASLSGYQNGVLLGALIVLAYTVFGGFRSASITDAVQAAVMFATLVIFPGWLLLREGGFTPILDVLRDVDGGSLLRLIPDVGPLALLGFLLGSGALGINLGYPGQPHVLVRFMAMRSKRDAIVAAVIACAWMGLSYFGAVTLGLAARAAVETGVPWAASLAGTDGEGALVVAAGALLPAVLAGLVLAGILSAVSSTADSQIVVAASALVHDVVRRLLPFGERLGAWANRLTVLVLGIAAAVLVFDEETQVFGFVLEYGWAVLGAGFGPQIALAVLWKRATWAGCAAGMFTGFVVAIGWKIAGDAGWLGPIELYNLTVAFTAALLVNVLVSLGSTPPAAPFEASESSTE